MPRCLIRGIESYMIKKTTLFSFRVSHIKIFIENNYKINLKFKSCWWFGGGLVVAEQRSSGVLTVG